MRGFFARRRTREPGWLAMSVQPGGLSFAHGVCASSEKCAITHCASRTFDGSPKDLERVAKDLGVERYQCLTILSPAGEPLLPVEAPNVPASRLMTAVARGVK